VLALAAALGLGACGGGEDAREPAGAPALAVATTVAPITSIVSTIGGSRVQVTGIVPEGTDSHTFEPRPSVAELLSRVDVLYLNGLGLEEPTRELAEANLRDGAGVVALGSRSLPRSRWIHDFSFPREEGRPNPHLWTSPTHALRYARVVRDDLTRRDPAGARHFAANYDAFAELVGRLDAAMRQAFATLPRERRRLLTYHDAYAYFARDYDWRVLGAIQVSDFGEPTPREVAALIAQVRRERVRAIFGSEVFPSPVLEQIGRETGVRYVDVLRDDDLPGRPGEPQHSWAGLMRFDFATMTEALGGDPSALEAFDPRYPAPDRAEYPQ
jgi:ABC-type Zn uptake system ZnuABC Zn-binding protein ZnuA